MKTIRKCDCLAGIALSCSLVFASTCSAQIILRSIQSDGPVNDGTVIGQSIPKVAAQHLGSRPIDMNNLPADILNCEVCRHRLGLPPLSRMPIPVVPASEVISPNNATPAKPLNTVTSALLPAAVPLAPANKQLELKQVIDELESQVKKQADGEIAASKKIEVLNEEREDLAAQRTKLNTQIRQMQADWNEQKEKAEVDLREAMEMLEKRSAEVTELEQQLKLLRKANEKLESQSKEAKDKSSDSDKPKSKKLKRGKGNRKEPK